MHTGLLHEPPLHSARVLIVEDESIIAKDIELSLKGLGYLPRGIVDTGLDAIGRVGSNGPTSS